MSTSPKALFVLAAGLIGAMLSASPARASGPGDLKTPYEGTAYSLTQPNAIPSPFDLQATSKGKLTGFYLDLPLTGKITKAGKLTFSGQGNTMDGTIQLSLGKGQLSATGQFILGSFTLAVTGSQSFQSGAYIFSDFSTANQPILGASGVTAAGSIPVLGDSYAGHLHDNKKPSLEDEPVAFTVATQGEGKFTGTLNGIPVSGKVTADRKVTFKGKLKQGGATIHCQGGGQTTSQVIIGAVTIKGHGSTPSAHGTLELYLQ